MADGFPIQFKKDGSVIHKASGTRLGSWRKEEDPVYAAGTFRVWKEGQVPEEGKTCFPRQNGFSFFRDQVDALEGRGPEGNEDFRM